jgi:hypothetical protein
MPSPLAIRGSRVGEEEAGLQGDGYPPPIRRGTERPTLRDRAGVEGGLRRTLMDQIPCPLCHAQ